MIYLLLENQSVTSVAYDLYYLLFLILKQNEQY